MIRFALLATLAATAVVAASPAGATWLDTDDPNELAARAELVVRASVVATRPVVDPDERIRTSVELSITDVIRGDAVAGAVIEVVALGGALGDTTVHVEGAADFVVGEEIVVFLRRGGSSWRLVGMGRGVYGVVRRDGRLRLVPGSRATERARMRTRAAGADAFERLLDPETLRAPAPPVKTP